MKKFVFILLIIIGVVNASAQTTAVEATPHARHYILDDIGQFVPTIANFTLSVCGVKAKNDWKDRIALTATSVILCEGVTYGLKHIVHSTRPDGTDNHSFPSGHSARAFRGAEMLRSQYGWAWGAGGYAVAVGVAALRIDHRRHRFGDVVGGAAIGFLSVRAAYLLLPLERKLFGWKKSDTVAVAIPSYTPETRTITLTASLTF